MLMKINQNGMLSNLLILSTNIFLLNLKINIVNNDENIIKLNILDSCA